MRMTVYHKLKSGLKPLTGLFLVACLRDLLNRCPLAIAILTLASCSRVRPITAPGKYHFGYHFGSAK